MIHFTSGEWTVGVLPRLGHIAVISRGVAVADCFSNRANARLVAAAPEMYGQLYEVLQLCEGHSLYEGDEFSQEAADIRDLLSRIDGRKEEKE